MDFKAIDMKKSFFIGLFLGLLSLSSFAQTRTEDFDLDPMRALIYEQEGLRYEDLQGDLYLLALRKKLGVKRGFAMLFGGFRKILDRDLELIEQAWAENPDWESIYRDYFSFQEREGIWPATGFVGPQTVQVLNNYYGK